VSSIDQIGVRRLLKRVGLGHRSRELVPLASSAVRIRTTPAHGEPLSVGASRIGGRPDLASGSEWPTWNRAPLAFLAQLDVADLRRHLVASPLPSTGLLSFFYDADQKTWGFDPEDRESWRVLYHPDDTVLAPTEPPAGLPRAAQFTTCSLTFEPTTTLPPGDQPDVVSLALEGWEWDLYSELVGSVPDDDAEPMHQVFGHPAAIQNGDMALECQLVANGLHGSDPEIYDDSRAEGLGQGSRDWSLLLQLDSDEHAKMMWGDAGRLFFWARRDEIEAARFDRSWMILQCG